MSELLLAGWIALGGGVGAAARYLVDVAVSSRWRRPFPLGTFLVNLSGSLALGLLVGALSGGSGSGPQLSLAMTMIGTGLLGGYTTFSTASYDSIRLASSGHVRVALVYALGSMLATVAAALVGLWAGAWWATVG